jgi:NAD(P)-dependent dehydrogenase (short-subunit alcohol dehydrogenase family)
MVTTGRAGRAGEPRLQGKAALVVGGGGLGIGAATARRFADEGAAVLVADLNAPGAERVAQELSGRGARADHACVDISDEASVVALMESSVPAFGGIDILFSSVAGVPPGDGNVVDMDLEVWRRGFDVTLTGTMLLCKHAIPHLLDRGGGSIVLTSSNSALAGDLSLTAYAAAKAGVNALTRSIATAFGKQGLRCNTVSPASINGPGYVDSVPKEVVEEMRDGTCLLPDLGTPEDVANTVLFLVSDEARFITGQIVQVDGGGLSHLPHVAFLRRQGARTTSR